MQDGIVERIRTQYVADISNPQLTVPEPPASTVAYVFAYLEKSLSFGEAFDRSDGLLRWPLGGKPAPVSSFGSADFCRGTRRYDAIAEQVTILDYANNDDFVLKLNSTSPRDEIILAKIQPHVTLRETIEFVASRINNSSLDEYARKPQKNRGIAGHPDYSSATCFGPTMRSRASHSSILAWQVSSLPKHNRESGFVQTSGVPVWNHLGKLRQHLHCPRHRGIFIFYKPFRLYLKERSASVPYFAMWVETAKVLEPANALQ